MTHTLSEHGNHFAGALLGRSGNFLIGWARNLTDADRTVTIDLLGDGHWMGSVRAELRIAIEDPQLNIPAEAEGHYFAFTIQPRDWQTIARFDAYVTNDGYHLNGFVFTHQEKQPLPQIHNSYVENYGGLRLQGWAWDTLDPEIKQTIYAYKAGRLLAESVANQYCSELEEAGCGTVNHGFSLTLPMELADGDVHEIQVITSQGQIINGSPVKVIMPLTTLQTWANALELPVQDRTFLTKIMARYTWHVPLSMDFSCYSEWFQRFGCPIDQPCPTTRVLVAVTGNDDVEKTLSSLISQSHSHWTALVCGQLSASGDSRIHYVKPAAWLKKLQKNINKHTGIVSFVTAGDVLSTDALASVVVAFDNTAVQIVYSDCDQISVDGKPSIPWFKPDWDPDLFLTHTPLHHLFATRPQNLAVNNPYIGELDAWPWLAVQSVGDKPEAIFHIPRVLYHRRNEATAPAHADAQSSCDKGLAPGLCRTITDSGENTLAWSNPPEWPMVSLIIPTRDHVELLQYCIESLLKTDYPNLEIIVMDNDSAEPEALSYLNQLKNHNVMVIQHPGAFNFSAINNHAVQHATGRLIGLINNDIEAIDSGWLKAMVRHLLRPNVGAVGAKLLWPNGMVQHAGVVLGLHGLVGHTGNDWHKDDAGYFGYNQLTHSASAVTAACLLCKREDYLAVGGLDEIDFPVNFNDVDFCLKLRRLGKRIVWTPDAQLLHAESASRGGDISTDRRGRLAREKNRLMQKWHDWITDDPYYNPNLNLDAYSHAGLAIPPRGRALQVN